jgi:hypothetical protein
MHPVARSKTSESELLAHTCRLPLEHELVLAADHAAKIARTAQDIRLGQETDHGFPDIGNIPLLAATLGAAPGISRPRSHSLNMTGP